MLAEKFPLQWPTAYPRTKWPKRSRFTSVTFARGRDEIFKQLRMMLSYQERSTIVLSTNIPLKNDGFPYASFKQPADLGVAVYFMYNKEEVCLACDSWDKIEHNMWAVAKTVENIRAIDRWGVSDFLKRSFSGFHALPPSSSATTHREWWSVLGYDQMPGRESWDYAGVVAQYKSLAKKFHPDVEGGSTFKFQELSTAYEQAKKYYGHG